METHDTHDTHDTNGATLSSATVVIELGVVSIQTKGGVEHMIEDRDPLV